MAALFVAMLVMATNTGMVGAAEYPAKPVTIIVPFSVGGGFDTTARSIQPWLKETLGARAVIVENKPGGGGAIGVSAFARRKADGYTMLVNDYTATALAYLTVEKAAFEYGDLIPLVTVTYDPRYFFVRKDSPYKDMNDLVEDIRKRPGKVTIAIPQGSGAHWQLEYIKKVMDLNARTVGYKGGGPALVALLGGHVDVFTSDGLGRVHVRERLRAIGVVAPERTALFPEAAPCVEHRVFKEKGVKEIAQAPAAVAVWVHKDVKEKYPKRFDKLAAALMAVKDHPGYVKAAKGLGLDKIAVWWGSAKPLEMKASIMKGFKGYPDVLKAMKK